MSPQPVSPQDAARQRDYLLGLVEGEEVSFMTIVKAMPNTQLTYKPEDRLMDFASLALHTARAGNFFANVVEAGASPDPEEAQPEFPPPPSTTDELASQISEILQMVRMRFSEFTPENLARTCNFFGFRHEPGVNFLQWHLNHLIHHRAQLGLYLRISGQKVPSMYGPTADISFEDMTANS